MKFKFDLESTRLINAAQRLVAKQRPVDDFHNINQAREVLRFDRKMRTDGRHRCHSLETPLERSA